MGWKVAALAGLISLLALPVRAQSHRAASSPVHIAMRPSVSGSAIRSIPMVGHPRSVTPRRQNNGNVNPAFSTNGSFFGDTTVQDLFGFPVPGLGFDFNQLAAVNSGLNVRALIDPVTQQEIALALRIRGLGIGGVSPLLFSPFGASPVVIESPAAFAPQADAPPAQQPIVVVAPPAPQATAPPPAAEQEQPLADPGEFVLVQRDGRLLFAVAFTSDPGRVVYITKEGLRRTVALDQLDVDATLRMNEERGSSIQIPKA